jgi:hypothetical protein
MFTIEYILYKKIMVKLRLNTKENHGTQDYDGRFVYRMALFTRAEKIDSITLEHVLLVKIIKNY